MLLQDNLLTPRPPWFASALAALGRHGFLTARQLAAVTHVERANVEPVLVGLVGEGLLETLLPTHAPGGRPLDPSYFLTRRGREVLRGLDERAPAPAVQAKRSRYTLAHDLLRNEFALVLEGLATRGVFVLHRWTTAREELATVGHVPGNGFPARVPLVADGLAVLGLDGETTAILVEIDRGTIGVEKMCTKYRGYLAWFRDQGPMRRFGLKSLRVLTVAPSEARLKRLREAALRATDDRGSGLFWFCPEAALDCERPDALTAPVATVARTGEPLLERLFV